MIFSPHNTALILIDLQYGIVTLPTAPYSGTEIVTRSKKTAQTFRNAGAPVIIVNVSGSHDGKDLLQQPTDQTLDASSHIPPRKWSQIVRGLSNDNDIFITKRQWGAFYGTDLDLQLRRRGINTIILGGIATNMGVESTARAAYEHGYNLVFLEDLTSGLNTEMHSFSFQKIFPLLGKISNSSQIEFK